MGTNLKIFTDGGCSGNPGPGGWAYIITEDTGCNGEVAGDRATLGSSGVRAKPDSCKIIAEDCKAEKNTTNNRMELLAVISALETVQSLALYPNKISIYTDSQYVQKGMTQWIQSWKQKRWMTSGKEEVKNKDLWLRLDNLASQFSINWVWIKGHAGNELNERCDYMIQQAIKTAK